MHKRRLFWQLYPACLLMLVFLAVVALYAVSSLRQFNLERTEKDLKSRALLTEEQFRPLLAAAKYAQIDDLCKELGERTATRFTVILPDGKVVGDSLESPARMDNHGNRREIADALAGGDGASLRYSDTLKETLSYAAVRLRQGGKTIGVVRAAVSLAAIDQALAGVRFHLLAGSLLAAGLLAVVSLVISRRIARPLEQLNRGAERFARGDLSHRLSVASTLEIGALAETLNQMAAELDRQMRTVVQQRNEREAVLCSMVEGVLAIDAEQRVLRMNQAASELLGVDAARAEGRILPEVVRNTDLQRLLTEVLASRQPAEGDVALRDRDQRMLYVHGTVLDDVRPGESGALLVLHDVTELRKLERMRRDFVANVSHELKTPVTSIQGFVETLLDGAVNDPQERDRFLRIVAAQTDRLSAIIDDLLTLARVEQGAKVVLSPGPVAAVLEAAVTTCKLMAEEMNVSLQWTCPPDLQATMNPSLLEQAVVNLIDNAVKYSAAGQTVRVEAGRADGEVFIRVIDQGCGIGSEHLPRIFERFYRVDKARSRKLGGTGLGLAIVKHIVQLHGGQVTVDSAPGRGSTFTVRIK